LEDAEGQHVHQDKLHQHAVQVQAGQPPHYKKHRHAVQVQGGQIQWHVLLDRHVQHHVQHLVPLDHLVQQDHLVQHVV